MLARYLIITAVAFALGFGIGTYWQSLLRSLDTATRDAADSKQVAQDHIGMGKKAEAINDIEKSTLKEMKDAASHDDDIRRSLAAGTHQLHLNAAPAQQGQATARTGLADGAGAGRDAQPGQDCQCKADQGATLNREVEPDYFIVRAALKNCPKKVTALQAILKEERNVGNTQ